MDDGWEAFVWFIVLLIVLPASIYAIIDASSISNIEENNENASVIEETFIDDFVTYDFKE